MREYIEQWVHYCVLSWHFGSAVTGVEWILYCRRKKGKSEKIHRVIHEGQKLLEKDTENGNEWGLQYIMNFYITCAVHQCASVDLIRGKEG